MTDSEKLFLLVGSSLGTIGGALLWEKILLKIINSNTEEDDDEVSDTIDYLMLGKVSTGVFRYQQKFLETYGGVTSLGFSADSTDDTSTVVEAATEEENPGDGIYL